MGLDREILAEYNATRDSRYTHLFCHAPFTSLNFEQNGNVTACCYNRKAVLGTYPEKSIAEIWHGPAASEFRAQMRSGSPPDGCEICVNQFVNRNFRGLKARFYDGLAENTAPDDGKTMPAVMEFEISNTCNLECIMCNGYYSSSIRKNREHLPPLPNPFDERFVAQLEPFIPHLKEARFLGGEPFLVKTYHRIWERIASVNPAIRVSITTNATVLTPTMKEKLEALEANIIISLDSLDPAKYENIRVNARFKDVMEHLSYFENYVARKGTDITIALCVMQQNWRELPAFLDFCNEHNLQLYCNTVLNPENATLRVLSSSQLENIARQWRNHPCQPAGAVSAANHYAYLDMVRQVEDYRTRAAEWEGIETKITTRIDRAGRCCLPLRSSQAQKLARDIMALMVKSVIETESLEAKMAQTGEDTFIAFPKLSFSRVKDEDIVDAINSALASPAIGDRRAFFFSVYAMVSTAIVGDRAAASLSPDGLSESISTECAARSAASAEHVSRLMEPSARSAASNIADAMVRRVEELRTLSRVTDLTGTDLFRVIPPLAHLRDQVLTTPDAIADTVTQASTELGVSEFATVFFGAVGAAAVALDWNQGGGQHPDSVTAKCDEVARVVCDHPARSTMMEVTVAGGALNVLNSFRELSLAGLLAMTESFYPVRISTVDAAPEEVAAAVAASPECWGQSEGAGAEESMSGFDPLGMEALPGEGLVGGIVGRMHRRVAFRANDSEVAVDIDITPSEGKETELALSSPALKDDHPLHKEFTRALDQLLNSIRLS